MPTVPILVMLGNRLCITLLHEAQLALFAADYDDAARCLREFRLQVKRHTQAKAEILYPRLVALNANYGNTLGKLRSEHAEIHVYAANALCRAEERNRILCCHAITRLLQLLSAHAACEQHVFREVGGEALDDLLTVLAVKLTPPPERLGLPVQKMARVPDQQS